MATPTKGQINANIGNAVRELAPHTTWKYHAPADGFACLEWMDDVALMPSESDVLAKAAEIAVRPVGA
jgi:hypothetical protein